MLVQYGKRRMLCDNLQNRMGDYQAMLEWLADWALNSGITKKDYWSVIMSNTTIDYNKNARQWYYQVCSQLGYLQTPPGNSSIRSQVLSLDFWARWCNRIYGDNLYPNTRHFNVRYGATHLAGSRIIFTNGHEDPWKWASVLHTRNRMMHPIEIVCDDCAHCVDLKSPAKENPEALTKAQKQIARIMNFWIKHERKHRQLGTPLEDVIAAEAEEQFEFETSEWDYEFEKELDLHFP